MTHENIQMLVSLYIDDEVTETEKNIVLTHLEACMECRKFVSSVKKMREDIKEVKDFEISDKFARRVTYLIEEKDNEVENWLNIEPLARNVFVALTIVVILLFVFTDSSGPESYTTIEDQILTGANDDSISTRLLIQNEELSKNDLLYAVMTK